MEKAPIKLNIKPFSVNDAWRGKKYKTPEYKDFENYVSLLLPKLDIPKKGPLRLYFWFGFSHKGSDYDNPIKPFQDILQKNYDFNDSRIYEGAQFKEIVPKGEEYVYFLLESMDESELFHREML